MTEFLNGGVQLIREYGLFVTLFSLVTLSLVRSRDAQTRQQNMVTAQFERQAERINALQVICDNQRDQINQLRGQMESERRLCKEEIYQLQTQIDHLNGGIS